MSALPLASRALSWLLLLPLIGLLVLAATRFFGLRRHARSVWAVAAAVGMAQLAVAIAVYAGFDVTLSRHDANQGFQFVERAVLLHSVGVEYALGVDGLSVGLVVLSAFAVTAGAVLGAETELNAARKTPLVLLIDLGVMGALVAIDLALILAFWGLALGAVALLIASGPRGARGDALRFARFAAPAYALVVAACVLLASRAGPAPLADGTSAAWAFSIPELGHADLIGKAGSIAGIPALKPIYSALFVGLAALMGIAPLHAWLSETIARVPAWTALLVSVAVSAVAAYLLLRIGYGVLPLATAWAAPTLGGLGALSVVWGAIAGFGRTDLKRVWSSFVAVSFGICLLSIGALTAIGIEGSVATIQNHVLSAVLVLGLAAILEARVGSSDLDRARGLLRASPVLAVIAGIGCLNQLGAPGSYAFVAHGLAMLGAVPLRLPAVVAVAAGFAVWLFSQARLTSKLLEPAGEPVRGAPGVRGPGSARQWVTALSAFAVVILGFWPKPMLDAVSSAALDHAALVNPPGPLEIVEEPRTRRASPLARPLLPPRPKEADPLDCPVLPSQSPSIPLNPAVWTALSEPGRSRSGNLDNTVN